MFLGPTDGGTPQTNLFEIRCVCVCVRVIFSALLTNIEPHKNIFPISAEISFLL